MAVISNSQRAGEYDTRLEAVESDGGPVKKAPTQLGTIGAPTPTRVWEIQPRDPDEPQFSVELGGGTFDSVWGNVVSWGWNIKADAGPGKDVASQPAIFESLEQRYDAGAIVYMERHLQTVGVDGTQKRWQSFDFNRSTQVGNWAFLADGPLGFRVEGVVNTYHFEFLPGVTSTKRTQFRYSGGGSDELQIGYDGGANAPASMSLGPSATADYNGVLIKLGGRVGLGVAAPLARFHVVNPVDADVMAILKGAASQSGDALQVQSSAAAVLSRFDSAGNLGVGSVAPSAARPLTVSGDNSSVRYLSVQNTGANQAGIELQNTTGYWLAYIAASGTAWTFYSGGDRVVFTAAGDVTLPTAGKGITLKSPDGLTTKKVTIDNLGLLALV